MDVDFEAWPEPYRSERLAPCHRMMGLSSISARTTGHRPTVAHVATAGIARLLVRVFFRHVEVIGYDRVPPSAPVVLVANHPSGLVDGLVLFATCARFPRLVGKSTLWRILPLRPFLDLAGVVPVLSSERLGRMDGVARAASTLHRQSHSTISELLCRREAIVEHGQRVLHLAD